MSHIPTLALTSNKYTDFTLVILQNYCRHGDSAIRHPEGQARQVLPMAHNTLLRNDMPPNRPAAFSRKALGVNDLERFRLVAISRQGKKLP